MGSWPGCHGGAAFVSQIFRSPQASSKPNLEIIKASPQTLPNHQHHVDHIYLEKYCPERHRRNFYLKILTPKKSVSKWVVAGKDNTPIRRNVLLFNAAPNSWNNPNKLRKSPNWRCHRARCPGCGRLEIGFAFPHFYSAAAGTRVTRRTPGTFSPSNYFHLFQCRESRHPRPQPEHSQVHNGGGEGGGRRGPVFFFCNSTSFIHMRARCPILWILFYFIFFHFTCPVC